MRRLPPPTVGKPEADGTRIWMYCRDCCHEVEELASVIGVPSHLSCPEVCKVAVCSKCGSRKIDVKGQIGQEPPAAMRARSRKANHNPTH